MSVHLCTFLSVLSVYVQYLCVFLLSLLCWMVYCLYWVFVCVCCAAPDKLTSPSPFTGLGALHLITDGRLYSSFMRPLKKPSFFFGDALASDELLAAEDEQWIYEAEGEWFFL